MSAMETQTSSNSGHLSATMTTTIMIVAVIVVFLLFIFALFLYLHAKKYWGANPAFSNGRNDHSVVPIEAHAAVAIRRGLDPEAVKELSSFVYKHEDFEDGLECPVCLSELSDGEEARLLPLCRHAFHVECIDLWFSSHSNCPLCRSAVIASDDLNKDNAANSEVVIEVGDREVVSAELSEHSSVERRENTVVEGSSSTSGVDGTSVKNSGILVIEVPRRVMERLVSSVSPLPLSSNPSEEVRTSTVSRLQSLQRILRGLGSPRSPRTSVVDVEQGLDSMPKTPRDS